MIIDSFVLYLSANVLIEDISGDLSWTWNELISPMIVVGNVSNVDKDALDDVPEFSVCLDPMMRFVAFNADSIS